MANLDVDLKGQILSNNEVGRGFNVKAVIDYNDFVNNGASESDDDTQTYQIIPLPIGAYVRDVMIYLNEAFDYSGSETSLTVQVGDTGDADGYVESTELCVDGTEVFAKLADGDYFNGTGSSSGQTNDVVIQSILNGKVYTTANTLEVLFTPDSSAKLSEATQGKITVLADIAFANWA